MDLQVIDQRPPLTAAIALAKKSPEGLPPKWRDDMAAMAAEVARKYFNALTEDAVRDGVEGTINLLSIGLLYSTEGRPEPELWLQTMRAMGVRGVSKRAVELIKTCDALPDYAAVYAGRDEYRPSLLLQVFSYAVRSGAERAYAFLLRETSDRTEVQRLIHLAEWLLANTATGRIARRDLDRFFGTETPDADAVIHRILSLACGVTKIDPFKEVSMDEEPEPFSDLLPISRLPAKRRAEARVRYEELVQKIPADLRPALIYHDVAWFDRFILPTQRKPRN